MSKIVIGLSGGVDSSVAAYLLKQQGHEVIGLFMRNWDSLVNSDILGNSSLNQSLCPQEQDFQDASRVAKQIGIPIYRVDFIKEYWDSVFENLIEQYQNGFTPNPDILCNKYIKFDKFFNYAIEKFGADYVAMGHYAIAKEGNLYRGIDQSKDQSYFLTQVRSQVLEKVIFPLGNMEKSEVRRIAQEANLYTANKKDSTGICFIGERKFTDFLQNYIPTQPGTIVDITTKKIVGNHIGAMYYTLGQRKGLNLGGMKEPYFVVGHDLEKKQVFVAPASEKKWLTSNWLFAQNLNLNNHDFNPENLSAKFRYRQKDVRVKVEFLENDQIKVYYPEGFEAVTPGQQIALYDGQKCLGGAVIKNIYWNENELNYSV
ncbi:TRNA (5-METHYLAMINOMETHYL-2-THIOURIDYLATE)-METHYLTRANSFERASE [Mycoplasmopsis pulmonis]|uniref:tRNA-specific 2-thiouridylase MnmA n=1 Tax=Mycoplasmopsis pulmonis (strain UAB CTIP) TaxID=272635 RepID=MNMA_MYCPU|nr:tRNA 2-thiouridine(34) synthase MnmA [Mycoplasmopsis pulmonis]Q98Q11.1 RecName: Full=tRNA-specific 2-thiouridylase MnmA [Mycoplasmopsis pulmonis UAB CTIP]MDZ7293638.1 tRNA 2-thiouridine(34) synthase MnmA [Mycoplasmopsis pulmonis]CAC13731.1 TRNA (5-METHYLAMINOMETHYL-2-THIOURIDYLATE)-METHYLTRANSFERASE [Mycoplasmopsis pulmonis]VEU68323.1 tRNA-specific 2-thiouridylase mnmA [Mycoplasmopsis pulmonis]